ncbi:hypothetical protein [Streptomyces subrutilus]|nr:hypothetical protein [Streptomyces subrutilus]
MLDFDGSQILLHVAEPVPQRVDGPWVELFIAREGIALDPYAY